MNTGHRMRRDGQEFAMSSCSTGKHAKVCRQGRGRVIPAASGSPKSRPKTLVEVESIQGAKKRDVLHMNRFDFESIQMQYILLFQVIPTIELCIQSSKAHVVQNRVKRMYSFWTISCISVWMSWHSSWNAWEDRYLEGRGTENCSKARISWPSPASHRAPFRVGLAACRLLAPADGVVSNGSRGHGGKACAAGRGSRDGNGWDNNVATGRASSMRCSASPAASGDGFRARAGDVLLAGAHAARVRRKQRKPTASGPR